MNENKNPGFSCPRCGVVFSDVGTLVGHMIQSYIPEPRTSDFLIDCRHGICEIIDERLEKHGLKPREDEEQGFRPSFGKE
jgi:hypothetical protein